jgi:hypothetical protein
MAGVVGDKRSGVLKKEKGAHCIKTLVLIYEKDGQVVHNQAKRSIDVKFQEFSYPPPL